MMKRLLGLLSLSIGLCLQLHAQLHSGGKPLGFEYKDRHELSVTAVPVTYLSVEPMMEELDVPDDLGRPGGGPYRFGHNIFVHLHPQNSGHWQVLADGARIWRLGIASAGALSLNLTFDSFRLPPGASLFIYSADSTLIQGAFTHANNQEDGSFSTIPIRTDQIYLEYYEPAGVPFAGELSLWRVTHGFRDPFQMAEKGFSESGDCHINVACEEADPWRDPVRSVVKILRNGSDWCTGTLINNSVFDGKPYILTANHCYDDPGRLAFVFNWQSESCANPAQAPVVVHSMSGAKTRARYNTADMWLLELNELPPTEFNVYYSGWNRSTQSPWEETLACIHHPNGDIKKFSWTDQGAVASDYGVETGTSHWRVPFWTGGSTEKGSSGSALFDSQGRIIGQLHGGSAACGNAESDWYGQLGISWSGGGLETSRLRDWLDPLQSGILTLDGYDPSKGYFDHDIQLYAFVQPQEIYENPGSIIPEFIIRNLGKETVISAEVCYLFNANPLVCKTWTGELKTQEKETLLFPEIDLLGGVYLFEATVQTATDQNLFNNTLSRRVEVFDCEQARSLPYLEDFNATQNVPGCWQLIDHEGRGQVWQFGRFDLGLKGTLGNFAYLNSDGYGSGNTQHTDLISPVFDFTGQDQVTLSFTHYYRHYGQSRAQLFYSLDDGDSWELIRQFTADTPANPSFFSETLEILSGKPQVRFMWKYMGSWAWSWSVDDIRVNSRTQPSFSLDLVAEPQQGGQVRTVCGQRFFHAGDKVNIQAEPAPNYRLLKWTKGVAELSQSSTFTYTMPDEDVVLVALFEENTLSESTGDSGIWVFPNPANQQISIQAPKPVRRIEVVDLRGAFMLAQSHFASEPHIDVSGLAPGMYLLRIAFDDEMLYRKLLIKRND